MTENVADVVMDIYANHKAFMTLIPILVPIIPTIFVFCGDRIYLRFMWSVVSPYVGNQMLTYGLVIIN